MEALIVIAIVILGYLVGIAARRGIAPGEPLLYLHLERVVAVCRAVAVEVDALGPAVLREIRLREILV